jgi:hypothetical protein
MQAPALASQAKAYSLRLIQLIPSSMATEPDFAPMSFLDTFVKGGW